MTLQNLTNLYEVIKTLKFELKPSINTKERIKFDNIKDLKLLENPSELLQTTKELASLQRSIFGIIFNLGSENIIIHKNLIKIIDSDVFYYFKNKQLSSIVSLSEVIKSIPEFSNTFDGFIKNIEDNLSKNIHKFESYILNIEKVYTKTEIGFAMKQYSLQIQKSHEVISLFVYKTGKIDGELKENLKKYFSFEDLENTIKICSQTMKSYNPTIGFEIHKFGFNSKSINKKADVDSLQKQCEKLEEEMEKLEEHKIQATQIFDAYTKQFNDYVIHGKERDEKTWGKVSEKLIPGDPKLEALKNNQTSSIQEIKEAKEYLKSIRDGNFDYQKINIAKNKFKKSLVFVDKIPNKKKENEYYCFGDNIYWDLKIKKTKKSIFYGKNKGDLFAKQTELFNQQKLTHYARLLRDKNNFFVAMVDRDCILELENIKEDKDIKEDFLKIMEYSSLTSKAVEKLIFERNVLNFDFKDEQFIICKKIRETRSYKEKGSTETQAQTLEEKQKLIQLVKFMNDAIGQINEKIENSVFDWKPFVIKDSFDDFEEFRKYITKSCYQTKRTKVSKDKIYELDKKGKINLYQIYNKDFGVDPYFAITERDKNSNFIEKKQKPNLFTIYWKDLFEQNGENIRLNPESKLYLRPSKKIEDIDGNNCDYGASKLRFKHNKIIADFQLVFYPTKKEKLEEIQKKIYNEIKEKTFSVGIDLGENSLATICLIDDEKRVVLDQNGNPIIKDLTLVNNKGGFVDIDNCFIENENYKRKDKLFIENDGSYFLTDWYFSSFLCQKPIKELSKEELKNVLIELEKMSPKELKITDTNGNKVFDYRYAFVYKQTENKIRYHLQSIGLNEEEKKFKELELMDTTRIKSGYVSKLVSYITDLAKEYNAVIVFENLDQKASYIKGITLLSEELFENVSSKEKSQLTGISVYQNIQNKIIRKCNLFMQKTGINTKLQITPKFKNIEEFKNFNMTNKDKNVGRGNVIFINEENSSKECPNCGFIPDTNPKIKDCKIVYKYNGEEKELNLDDEKIKDRKEYKKIGDLMQTRIKYTDLSKSGKWYIDGDPMVCVNCGYDTRKEARVKKHNLKSCDEIAAYIVAKRGLEFIKSQKVVESISQKQINNEKIEIHKNQKNNGFINEESTISGNIVFSGNI